ncbi:MAG TPA: multicopper oxidase domain-containing protein [Candidatus Tumulicola sp.]
MMRKRCAPALALAGLMLAACGGGGGGPAVVPQPLPTRVPGGGAPLPVAPEVDAIGGVATVELAAQIDPATALPAFVYRGRKGVVPTIRVKPGDTIVVDVVNNLPAAHGMQSDLNLHFHGLTVSPNPPADDVITTLAMAGGSLHYVVPIPKNQEPGLYWYHPHVFPETDFQVGQAGISGAIVIAGLERHLPGLAKMKERLILIRQVAATGANIMTRMRPHDEEQNNNPCGPDPGLTVTTNGAVAPAIAIAPGEQQFFRVVNATGHKNLKLAVDDGTIELVAIDGFALDKYPGTAPTSTVRSVVVPPAGRAEFVVTGPGSGASEFRTLCYDSGPSGDPDPSTVLADLRAPAGRQHATGAPFPARRLRVGAPLPNDAFSWPLPHVAAKRTIVFSEDDNGMYINGKQFSMASPPMFVVRVGTVEQWQVVNVTEEVHDFHMHQTHFFVQQVNGVTVAHPHWADSVVVPHRIPGKNGSWKPGYLTLLIDFRDPVIRGEFMFHCHILDHEDAGMMAKIQAI